MPFTHVDKVSGDLIHHEDWNAMGQEVTRLGTEKADRGGDQTLAGTLAVQGGLTVGTADRGGGLRVLKKQEDGTGADHGAVILGTGGDAGATLRLGYGEAYSWIQGQGKATLALNPRGGNVGIGLDAPQERLEVAGALRVGSGASPLQVGGGGHTGFVNAAIANAEISNDTKDYKTLMILGNRSAGIGRRVSVWDRLEVNGTFAVTGAAAVGGAATVAGTLTVSGAITPAAGNAETAGIMFPRDPGGGSGDAAWMRYYARSGEACTLELGTANDPDDHIALMPSGNVGIGVNAPRERLEVAGAIRVGSGGNPLQIGGAGHTGFVNLELANAEISNDTRDYKTLMILGNRSAGIGRRVSVWDRLEVNGTLAVTGDVSLAGGLVAPGAPEGTRVLRGSVKANGDLEGGVGFTVKRVGTGMYDITFATAFTARPSGVATQVYPNFDDFGTGGDTRDNAVIVGLNASRMRIKTGGGDGGASDRCFCFVVFGPR